MISIPLIDVTSWRLDEEHGIFPVGARDKKMLWSPIGTGNSEIKSNWPYLFKLSREAYPDQFWIETIAYIVSEYCQIDVPPSYPAYRILPDGKKEYGALLEWFYDRKQNLFVHSSDFFHALNRNFDDRTGCHHNLDDLAIICRFLSRYNQAPIKSWQSWLCEMLFFDTLIGNSDRHQQNWGMVFTGSDDEHDAKWYLSPLYDNGTSLGHERFPDRVKSWSSVRLDQYILQGSHHIRKQRNDTKTKLGHIESVRSYLAESPFTDFIKDKLRFDINKLSKNIELLCEIDAEEFSFTKDRASWTVKLLKRRYQMLTLLMNMRIINNYFEPSTLLLTWQPPSGGTRYVVGKIDKVKDEFVFSYCFGTSDFEDAKLAGFKGYPAFLLGTQEHKNNVLEPFLARLPPRKRKDFGEYLEQHFLPRDFTGSDFVLLGYTGAKSPADGFSLILDPAVIESQSGELLLEVAGTRYQSNLDLSNVLIGDDVVLQHEPQNRKDKNAIQVMHKTGCLGYVNRVLSPSLLKKLAKKKVMSRVARKNGTPDRPLVYILLEID